MQNAPQPTQMQHYGTPNFGTPTIMQPPNPMDMFYGKDDQQRINQQNNQIIREIQQYEKQKAETLKEIYKEANTNNDGINYNLPSFSNRTGTVYYRDVFNKMLVLNDTNYSVKDVNFDIENAYFENKLNKAEFDKYITQTAEFLLAKMKELNYDNSNSAKNLILFKYFSEVMSVKGFKDKHFPIKYDFDDYWGAKNWDKMFVTKLLRTNSGQCHSMPLLYLTLAEQIGAVAYLSLSPNHSYIKFQDEKEKWYNLELTNGMFTVSSFILNNGFIRAEAIQNKIYMQNLSKKELLSQFYTDLASGYIHKFGYDEFVYKIIQKALQLYPNSINAQMHLSIYQQEKFRFVTKQLNINPENKKQLQQIKYYPKAVQLLNQVNLQFDKIDDLGFQFMPLDAYEKWLGSLKQIKNKQESQIAADQIKGLINRKVITTK